MDEAEAQIVNDVAQYGWHMLTIPEDDVGPGFTYTVGLFRSYSHPEVIVFGLPNEAMQRIIDIVATLVKGGRIFDSGEDSAEILDGGFACAFRKVASEHYAEYLGCAIWFYKREGTEAFPVLQCLWPDNAHRFPWDARCEPAIRALQPALYL